MEQSGAHRSRLLEPPFVPPAQPWAIPHLIRPKGVTELPDLRGGSLRPTWDRGVHMRPSGPGVWGVCGPPAATGDTHRKKAAQVSLHSVCSAHVRHVKSRHLSLACQAGSILTNPLDVAQNEMYQTGDSFLASHMTLFNLWC